MRPYDELDYNQVKDYINLVIDNYRVVDKLTITPGIIEGGDYGLIFTFNIGTSQETADEYIFNEDDELYFEVDSDIGYAGFFENLAHYVTFYYYELDKADIDDTKPYDNIKTWNFTTTGGDGFTISFDKQTYLLKEFQVITKKMND